MRSRSPSAEADTDESGIEPDFLTSYAQIGGEREGEAGPRPLDR